MIYELHNEAIIAICSYQLVICSTIGTLYTGINVSRMAQNVPALGLLLHTINFSQWWSSNHRLDPVLNLIITLRTYMNVE